MRIRLGRVLSETMKASLGRSKHLFVRVAFAGLICLPFSSKGDSSVVAWGHNIYGQADPPSDLTNVVAIAAGSVQSVALRSDGTVSVWGQDTAPAGLSNVAAIACGSYHNLALQSDGSITIWGGANSFGQNDVPPGLSNVVAVTAGTYNSLALTSEGTLRRWGFSAGSGSIPSNVVALAAGYSHNLALRADGTVAAWGQGLFGENIVPPGLSNVVAIAADTFHNLALKADGTVVAWGSVWNGVDQVSPSPPQDLTNVVAIAAGSNLGMALKADGRVVVWGFVYDGNLTVPITQPPSWTNATAIAAGSDHVLALIGGAPPLVTSPPVNRTVSRWRTAQFQATATGTMPLSYQWRFNAEPILGATNILLSITNALPDAAGSYSFTVSNGFGSATSAPASLTVLGAEISLKPTNQVAVLGGSANFQAFVNADVPLGYQWQFNGTDLPAATNVILSLVNLQQTQAGYYSARFTDRAGVVQGPQVRLYVSPLAAWGAGTNNTRSGMNYGQAMVPLDLTNVLGIAAGGLFTLALNTEGTVAAWGSYFNPPTTTNMLVPAGLTNVEVIAAGHDHALAIRSNGTVVAWGRNSSGQTNVPTGLSNVVAVAGGSSHSLALKSDGTVTGWGNNASGQRTPPPGLTNVVAVAAGENHSLALLSDGLLVGWGDNSYGQKIPPPGLSNIIAVAAGSRHSLALLDTGTVVAWGDNAYSQTNLPGGLTNVVAISARLVHSLAVTADGRVVAWGAGTNYSGTANNYGQSIVPTGLTNVLSAAAGAWHSIVLVGSTPRVQRASLTSPARNTNAFSVSIPTLHGRVYRLEYKSSLNDNNWIALSLVAGNGGVKQLTDSAATEQTRFYRVRQW
jgi:alpha-tubulin suppressor-like RCC1 family protein